MYQHAFTPIAGLSSASSDIDDSLWRKIDAAVGEPIHLDRALFIEDESPQPPIMVLVVERHPLPGAKELSHRFGLTPREIEVALLLVDRLSDEEIARRLHIKLNTARCHSNRVLGKLGVHSRNHVRRTLLDGNAEMERPARRNVA